MRSERLSGWVIVVGLLGSALAASAAPSPQDVLTRAKQAMGTARTYQAVVLITTSGGPGGAATMRMDVKLEGKSKRSYTITPVGQPSGALGMLAATGKMVFIDDGKQAWLWVPTHKQYIRVPPGEHNAALPNIDFSSLPANDPRYTYQMLPATRIGGRPVDVVRVTPKEAGAAHSLIEFYVDQGTHRFKQIKNVITNPRNPQQHHQTLVTIQNDVVNQPLAAGTFSFVPPRGATEVKRGMGGPVGAQRAPGPGGLPPGGAR